MTITDMCGTYEVSTVDDLERLLGRRYYNNVNSFWLVHGSERYPALSVCIKGELAYLQYAESGKDAGLRSAGTFQSAQPGEMTTFSVSKYPADDISVLNDAVVTTASALAAAKEFYTSKQLPTSVDWVRL
jgi:hypothetical protein